MRTLLSIPIRPAGRPGLRTVLRRNHLGAPLAAAFREYMDREGNPVARAMFERNLAGKIGDAQFNADMSALLRPGFEWRSAKTARTVSEQLISLLPGEPWKGETDD